MFIKKDYHGTIPFFFFFFFFKKKKIKVIINIKKIKKKIEEKN